MWIALERAAVFAGEDPFSVHRAGRQVHVAVGGAVPGRAIADLQVEHRPTRLIDELVAIRLPGRKSRRHARGEPLPAGIGDKRHLPFQNVDEFILFGMPVAH
jgi:hypothetical protein